MTSLSGRAPKDTFGDLLQISNSNTGIDATLRTIEDGKGTSGPWQISTVAFRILATTTMDVASGGIVDIKAGTFKADAIAESTAAAGVTIDGVLLKDGGATLTALLTGTTLTMTGLATLGDIKFNTSNPGILGDDTDGVTFISAGASTTLGANLRLFGDTHATGAGDVAFRNDATTTLLYDLSGTNWDFQANDITTTGETFLNLPTSAGGTSGSLWSDSGTVKVVP